ncbi:MAG: crossover junction endodeoxyribonuclease RuvC [Acidobacteriota bacterium]
MIALGVDSGSRCTGFGVVERRGGRDRALSYGALRLPGDLPHPQRLLRIHEALRDLIAEHHPDVAALEGVFVAGNVQSALKLGQVRGAVMVACAAAGLPLLEFSPAEVKTAVAGYGRAEKHQVQAMVKAILGLADLPSPSDAADALALALCALSASTSPLAPRRRP